MREARRWSRKDGVSMAKDKITKKEAATGAADMIYALGQGLGMGTRGPGRFVDLLGGTGLAVAGTNREGVTGALIGDKFVPTSENYYKAPGGSGGGGGGGGGGNNMNNRPDEDEEGLDKKPTKNKPRVPRGASWSQIVGAYFPRTREPRKDNQSKTMKEGGLVRGAGKAERGRGRGKMV